jgi:hypothetical protein
VLSLRAARAFFVGRGASLPPLVGPAAARAGAAHALLRRLAAAQGRPLSDEQQREIAAETCEGPPEACATRLAWWSHQHPESAALAQALATLRERRPLARHLAPERLRELATLFEAGTSGAEASPEQAARLTDLFVDYYLHSAPFSRAALAGVWRRCNDTSGGARCLQGLARAEQRVGPLRRAARARAGAARG